MPGHRPPATGHRVAIVSNNSAEAIHAYLELHGLSALVAHVQGRDRQDPSLMKPNPRPLFEAPSVLEALSVLDVKQDDAVLIGDSLTDIEAA